MGLRPSRSLRQSSGGGRRLRAPAIHAALAFVENEFSTVEAVGLARLWRCRLVIDPTVQALSEPKC
jgi:hypothetical protein